MTVSESGGWGPTLGFMGEERGGWGAEALCSESWGAPSHLQAMPPQAPLPLKSCEQND